MKVYMHTIQIEFVANDDAEARSIFAMNEVTKAFPVGHAHVKEKLQEVFQNKAPRKVEI